MNALLEWWTTLIPWALDYPLNRGDMIGVTHLQIAIIIIGIFLIISFKNLILGEIELDIFLAIMCYSMLISMLWPVIFIVFIFFVIVDLLRRIFAPNKAINWKEKFNEIKNHFKNPSGCD